MFRPNQNCQIQRSSGKNDVYGMPVPGTKYNERCSVIKMNLMQEKSSVRADTSASRGTAMEEQTTSVFLLAKTTVAEMNDMIIHGNYEFRIVGKFPRYDARGNLDHYEITCDYWGAR